MSKKREIVGKEIEYVMDKAGFYALANTRDDSKSDPFDYVIDLINSTYGLLGTVTKIRIEG